MPFLRIAAVFLFAVFAFANAQLADFSVISTSGSTTITFGETITLAASPANGTFIWRLSSTKIADGATFSPTLAKNPVVQTIETYTVERLEDNREKSITITINPRPEYNVIFNLNGGTGTTPATQKVMKDSLAKIPTEQPTQTGYDFDGWDFNFSSAITKDTTIFAKWKAKPYTVSFNSNGGSEVLPQTVLYGNMATAPASPTRVGYTFDYWENGAGNGAFAFNAPVTGNITLTAKWLPLKFTVSFEGIAETQTIDYNASATTPAAVPAKTGYSFDGWDFNFSSAITKDTAVKAKWKANAYTLTFDAQGGTVSPASKTVTYNSTIGTLPEPQKTAHEFKGWFTEIDGAGAQYEANTIYTLTNNTTLYAKWEFVKGSKPLASMLDYSIPTGLTYTALPISPIAATQKTSVIGTLGNITALYALTGALAAATPPTNAGTYAITAFIAKSADYDSATVSLGTLTIGKANFTPAITSATAQSKVYDGTDEASASVNFGTLLGTDIVSNGDYSITAKFADANAGTGIAVSGTVNWLASGNLSKNYNLQSVSLPTGTNANITRATGFLIIEAPELYELSNPQKPTVINKNSFVKNEDITWEYKKEGDFLYSNALPNRVGTWLVKATLPETQNYTGASDSASFPVARGNATTIIHKIEFTDSKFVRDTLILASLDSAKSGTSSEQNDGENSTYKLKKYFVASSSLCKIADTEIKITVQEPDIILSIVGIPQKGSVDSDGFTFYELPFTFGKPGLDTLIYSLLSRDGIYAETDTILLETHIPFDSIIKQKWNNVLFVNNNPASNGDYKFTEFEWFKNGISIGNMQFYSAGAAATDTLSSADKYKATMRYEGSGGEMRISSCEGSPILKTEAPSPAKKLSKIYNVKGEQIKEKSRGIYVENGELKVEN